MLFLLPLSAYSSNYLFFPHFAEHYKRSLEVNQLACISNQPWETGANCLNYCLRARWGDLKLEINQGGTNEDRAPEWGELGADSSL